MVPLFGSRDKCKLFRLESRFRILVTAKEMSVQQVLHSRRKCLSRDQCVFYTLVSKLLEIAMLFK